MLQKLSEQDFLALRSPFESGRQAPKTLGAVVILFIFF
ncbi:hypothetical protein Pryu01_02173 [Paraliobacillus ryukyuensis]|uniref:Uncharacterized protein n=1 Tax=Paraliobacillus ryukyuensis TaxID=200904 RepID=A0A366E6H2_9BACI|nr:hypothetical protein DES48_10710 [Paraliobacillus ryukyuensis]